MLRNAFVFTIFIASISFKGIFGRLNEQITTGIINDLNPNCVNETGVNVQSIINLANNCIQDEFKIIKQHANNQSNINLWKILICNDEVVQRCNKLLSNSVNPCLSNVSLDVLNEINKVKEIAVDLLCADDGKNIQVILEGNEACVTSDCDVTGEPVHLEDFFSLERCEKYKTFIQCKAGGSCPHLNHIYEITLKTMYQASPCTN
uniref:DUF19 domain-containing protein n=1 Tax=Strigamia maritima TaxID=126957 RepID=T1INY2_STRMM